MSAPSLLRSPHLWGAVAGALITGLAFGLLAEPVPAFIEWQSLHFAAYEAPVDTTARPHISADMEVEASLDGSLSVIWLTEAGGVIRTATFIPVDEEAP